MDKINLVSSFQKSIDALKTTECSQKEKLAHFAHISDFITSPSIQNHPNQIKFISNALAVLLMFCEEIDSTVHLNAEENLNKIIRFCEKTNIVRIQYDLYHEIKKNGNERSLRICLNIFGYYCHLIKQRKVKPYATNFLPCFYAISKRKETQLIETLCEFLKTFSKFMENCLSDRDVLKLVEVFLNDTTSECAIKRRCASQNVMTLIMNSKKPEFICRQAFNKSLEILTSDQTVNAVIGVLGMLRLLIPEVAREQNCDFNKIIQILDVCLQLLHDKSHSLINASLEVIHAILRCSHKSLNKLLTSSDHIDIIRHDDSLRNVIFKKNGSKGTSTRLNEIDRHYFEMNSSRELESSMFSKDTQILDEACLSCTDIEMDSLKSIDSSHESENVVKKSDTTSLKSQKSTESFGSFFNSLLLQSKPTETVTKFFRSQGSSLNNTPKKTNSEDNTSFKDFAEDDAISAGSLDSNISIHSSQSSSNVMPTIETDETATIVETAEISEPDQPSQQTIDIGLLPTETFKLDESTESIKTKEMTIGTIYDQCLIEYVVRLVCYKFLLSGQEQKLKLDSTVRVSIKNLTLIVLSDCVRIYPQILLMKLTVPSKESVADEKIFHDISDLCLEDKVECRNDELLDIKPDHFGTSTCSFDDFLSPLTESRVKIVNFCIFS